ncbi:MAG: hypothetical protein Q7S96_01965 [bacterium]|nr:hypothetical protein [bacterium]
MTNLQRLALPAAALVFMGAGCISFSGGGADGGLFVTTNRGDTWEQRGAVVSVSGGQSLAQTNVLHIEQDPNDVLALYAATEQDGAFASWDGGVSWRMLGAPFAKSRVSVVATHPTDRCTFYVAGGQRIYRSFDCGRNWEMSDFEANASMTALAIDPITPSIIYAGNSRGDLLLSTDRGTNWRTVHRAGNVIVQLLALRVGGSSAVIASTERQGLLRSTDRGVTWESLRSGMESFASAFNVTTVVPIAQRPGSLLHASQFGLLRSSDLGSTWEAIPLLTKQGSVTVTAAAVDPQDRNRIVYATRSTFYRTSDGGKSWESKKLPTSRYVTALMVDRRSQEAVWMGTKFVEESKF